MPLLFTQVRERVSISGDDLLARLEWYAHRQLAETIHQQMRDLLASQNHQLHDLQGLIFFKGPGSFTGLRIGASVANALSDALQIPIVGTQGDDWVSEGVHLLQSEKNHKVVVPEYGAPARTTVQKK